MVSTPLKGLRVVTLEQFGSGPYATMFLAALGAEVLKIEFGQGDFGRAMGPLTLGKGDSLYFQAFNLNKKSIRINLKDKTGRSEFEQIIGCSDVCVNNMRGSIPARLGLDYHSLKTINRKIVCGHISAYGRNNSRASRPGYDFLMQAEAGLMSLTGEPDAPPARSGVSIIDYMAGMTLVAGILSALRAAEETGCGTDVDVSLFDVAVHQLAYQGTWFLNEGRITGRAPRSAHPSATPVQLFKTSDGWIYVACMNDTFWDELCVALHRPDLGASSRYSDMDRRLENRDELTAELDLIFATKTSDEWVANLAEMMPIASVKSLEQALSNPFLLEEVQMVAKVPHPAGELRVLANPILIGGERLRLQAAPRLGEDTADVFSTLHVGSSRTAIDAESAK